MQYLNDDMDDVFKMAAENYPLRTDTADWEKLRKEVSSIKTSKAVIKNNFKWQASKIVASFLLLLIPFSVAVTKYFSGIEQAAKDISAPKGKAQPDLLQSHSQSENFSSEYKSATSLLPSDTKKDINLNTIIVAHEDDNTPALANGDIKNEMINKFEVNNNILPPLLQNNTDAVTGLIPKNYETVKINKETGTDKQDQILKPKKSPRTNRPRNFYMGLVISPEISSVKSQQYSKPGFNLGILAGYAFNSKLDAEIAVLLSHKYYYSDGKYVESKSLRRDNAQINSINVFNSITAIPVTLRYNINNSTENKFFVNAGAVTYIIHKETYDYLYTKRGEEKEATKQFNKSLGNVFSNLQLSFGYERKLGNIGNLRAEPYYRIPLNGIGANNLPVTNIGVNFIFSKYLK